MAQGGTTITYGHTHTRACVGFDQKYWRLHFGMVALQVLSKYTYLVVDLVWHHAQLMEAGSTGTNHAIVSWLRQCL